MTWEKSLKKCVKMPKRTGTKSCDTSSKSIGPTKRKILFIYNLPTLISLWHDQMTDQMHRRYRTAFYVSTMTIIFPVATGFLAVLFLCHWGLGGYVNWGRCWSAYVASSLSIAPPLRWHCQVCTFVPADKETAIVLWIKIWNYMNVHRKPPPSIIRMSFDPFLLLHYKPLVVK